MGITKQYLRFAPAGVFGVVASARGNIAHITYKGDKSGRYCAVPACENVLLWDMRKQEQVFMLDGDKHEVTCVKESPDNQHLAVGYSNGNINLYNIHSTQCTVTFSAHKTAVTALSFDSNGLRLASGGKDTQIVLWDIVCERGLYKLSAHKDMVTCIQFLQTQDILVTSSKDSYIKFWDLDTQHCFKTLVSHRAEVWSFIITSNESTLVTGSSDQELRVWKVKYLIQNEAKDGAVNSTSDKKVKFDATTEFKDDNNDTDKDSLMILEVEKFGSVSRNGRSRVDSISTDVANRVIVCHGTDGVIDVFKICNDDEIRKSVQKRERKRKKKLSKDDGGSVSVNEDTENLLEAELGDEIKLVSTIKLDKKQKVKSCAVVYNEKIAEAKVSVLVNNNSIEQYSVCLSAPAAADTPGSRHQHQSLMSVKGSGSGTDGDTRRVLLGGHPSDVRAVAFSHDSTAILSAGGQSARLWNQQSLRCVRSMPCEYALCCMFAPGDRHAIIGTKSGAVQIFDVASASLLRHVPAHEGAVWSMAITPDMYGFATASADKMVKFWNFELTTVDTSVAEKQLSIEHTRTLELDEDAMCVKFASNNKLLAVALLDSTVKVFYVDTLRFFLSLYGHKLPVLCMDISTDCTLIVTGSADRNIKIWGLDFGDCHKSLFAHDDSIMSLQFLPNTHMFFSAGKDKMLKQWDADNFEKILTLQGHHAEIWCLAISSNGKYVVTASHDKSLRLWHKTEEPLVLEEEKEMEREAEQEADEANKDDPTVLAGESSKEIGLAGKKTAVTLTAADRLMEALDIYKEQKAVEKESGAINKKVELHTMIKAFNVDSGEKYVLEVIKRIKSSELEKCVLLLQFSYMSTLLPLLSLYMRNDWELELCSTLLFFLLRVHHQQIISNHALVAVIEDLREHGDQHIAAYRDMVGFNIAGLQFLQQQLESADDVQLFADATKKFRDRKRKKKKQASAAVLTVNAL